MNIQKHIDMQEILRTSKIGLWRVEVEDAAPPRFYADNVMDHLLGITGEVSPEERFCFHRAHIHPDDSALFDEYSNKLSNVRTEIVYRYIHPVSGEMLVRCSGSRDASISDYISIIGTHQDISETTRLEQDKFAERRLAEMNHTLRREQVLQENYYRDLLDIQSCGVMAYTLPGHRLIHMNAEALRMYGLRSVPDAQRNLGNVLSRIYYPDSQTVEHLKTLRNDDDSVDYECVLNKGAANECHVVAKTKVFRIPSGERAVVTTFLDVSDMIILRNALKKAEEGSRAKSSFLFAMSHDLRTPMNAIIGYAELMEAHWGEKERTSEYLYKLKDASHFLLALIGNILEMARIESGKETLHEEPCNMFQICDTVHSIMANDISQKNIDFTQQIHIQHPDIICDAMKVREIYMNLISNAIKYTSEGGQISLTIDELPSDTKDFVTFKTILSDNGIGIGREYIPHLFEAFSREKSSSESGIIGTGLGLKIVKSFVDLMGGSIEVDSEPGKGTSFFLTLSFRIASQEETVPETVEDPFAGISLKGKRILLAEDNALNAEITTTILNDAGFLTEHAVNGDVALSMLKTAPVGYYDLILMDIQMPVLNGYQAARQIRTLKDSRARIPIIAMTANAFKEDRDEALASGMDDYIVKPVNISNLLHTIAAVISQKNP